MIVSNIYSTILSFFVQLFTFRLIRTMVALLGNISICSYHSTKLWRKFHKEEASIVATESDSFTKLALQESGNILVGPNGTHKKTQGQHDSHL